MKAVVPGSVYSLLSTTMKMKLHWILVLLCAVLVLAVCDGWKGAGRIALKLGRLAKIPEEFEATCHCLIGRGKVPLSVAPSGIQRYFTCWTLPPSARD